MIDCKYGHFTDDGREYVITDGYTPRPWINVISNGDYSILISQMGGGYSYRTNAEQNRITRSFQDLIKDNWGKYFYIRDLDNSKVWSTALKPIESPVDKYEVRHGIGYSILNRTSYGISSSMKVFVSAES
ncbi:MAG: glycosyl transferase family 36, partial [Clostridia bacterium]